MDALAKELALVGKTVEVQQADFMISGVITSISGVVSTKPRNLSVEIGFC